MKKVHFLALDREQLVTLHANSFWESLELVKEIYRSLGSFKNFIPAPCFEIFFATVIIHFGQGVENSEMHISKKKKVIIIPNPPNYIIL